MNDRDLNEYMAITQGPLRPIATHVMITECPCCGKVHDRVAGLRSDARPREGDTNVCTGCGGIVVFNAFGRLEVIPDKIVAGPDFEYERSLQRRFRRILGLPVKS